MILLLYDSLYYFIFMVDNKAGLVYTSRFPVSDHGRVRCTNIIQVGQRAVVSTPYAVDNWVIHRVICSTVSDTRVAFRPVYK